MATIPTDPLFAQQWYLLNGAGGLDLDIVDVWDDYTGAGVQVAIIDDGFDLAHVDLAANFRTDIDYDYINFDTMPLPGSGEHHGTAVAGIIAAAEGNGVGGVGVAWDATLVGYRNASNLSLDDAILDAAGLGNGVGNTAGGANGSDIVNMSFGFAPLFLVDPSFDQIEAAMAEAAALGRGGLGTIFVKSAGNGRAELASYAREEGTAEVMDTSALTINVGAVRADGWVTDFSTPGANLLISAFSNDALNQTAITTTDRTGSAGFESGDFVASFGGTSATAPQVSGIIALMLEANPDLGWRDVQQILALSARHVGSAVGGAANAAAPAGGGFEQATQPGGASWFWNGATGWNGGGLHFSNDYGFGLVDARAAVRLAESWGGQATSANRVTLAHDLVGAMVVIPDGNAAGRSFAVAVGTSIAVEHVAVELEMAVGFLSDLEIYLTSPSGTRVQMIAATGGSGSFSGRWSFGAVAFMGEASAGTWTVTVVDAGLGDAISLTDMVLSLHGAAADDDDLWVFTDAFAALAASGGRLATFDGGAGRDTINAAAMRADAVFDLAAGSAVIGGVSVALASVEEVLAGDGNDRIAGTAGDERLAGGRGNDTLRGNGGADSLLGGRGDDLFLVGSGQAPTPGALFDGGEGWDVLAIEPDPAPTASPGGAVVFDFSGSDFLSIEELRFAPAALAQTRVAVFDDQEFDAPGEVSAQLLVRGQDAAGMTERIVIRLGVNQTLDLSAWSFADWGAQGEAIEIVGDASDETVVASSQADEIATQAGNDSILAGAGNDRIDPGAGRDTVDAGAGDDIVIDGDGLGALADADSLDGGAGIDTLVAIANWSADAAFDLGAGLVTSGTGLSQDIRNFENLTIAGSARVIGTEGANVIVITGAFPSSGTVIEARGGDDRVTAGAGADSIDGGAGNDILRGGHGFDTLSGGVGNDVLHGNTGADWLDGGDGRDVILGGIGHDRIFGGADDDTLDGGAGADTIEGGGGNDVLIGWFGDDRLFGDGGADRLEGRAGNDLLRGGDGADSLFGNAGDDVLGGGPGEDALNGGAGADIFLFDSDLDGNDRISRFEDGIDRIELSGLTGVGTFADLAIVAQGWGSLVTAGTVTITVAGLAPAFLGEDDFIFS